MVKQNRTFVQKSSEKALSRVRSRLEKAENLAACVGVPIKEAMQQEEIDGIKKILSAIINAYGVDDDNQEKPAEVIEAIQLLNKIS